MQRRVHAVFTTLRLDHLAERDPTKLSDAQSKRLSMSTVMVLEPDVSILDDPFTGFEADSAETLARALRGCGGAVIALGNREQHLLGEVFTFIGGSLILGSSEPVEIALAEPVRSGALGDGPGEVADAQSGWRAMW